LDKTNPNLQIVHRTGNGREKLNTEMIRSRPITDVPPDVKNPRHESLGAMERLTSGTFGKAKKKETTYW